MRCSTVFRSRTNLSFCGTICKCIHVCGTPLPLPNVCLHLSAICKRKQTLQLNHLSQSDKLGGSKTVYTDEVWLNRLNPLLWTQNRLNRLSRQLEEKSKPCNRLKHPFLLLSLSHKKRGKHYKKVAYIQMPSPPPPPAPVRGGLAHLFWVS